MSDYMDRTLGLGYVKGSGILVAILLAVLALWRLVSGSLDIKRIVSRRDELF